MHRSRLMVAGVLLFGACAGNPESLPLDAGSTTLPLATTPSSSSTTALPESTTVVEGAPPVATTAVVATTLAVLAVPTTAVDGSLRFGFGVLPDGTAMNAFIPAESGGPRYRGGFIDGGLFADFNVVIAGGDTGLMSCVGTTPAVILLPANLYEPAIWFLTTARAPEIEACWSQGIRLDFNEPVRSVTLGFQGAAVPYYLFADDAAGGYVISSEVMGVIGDRIEIRVEAAGAVIASVEFGNGDGGVNWIQDVGWEP